MLLLIKQNLRKKSRLKMNRNELNLSQPQEFDYYLFDLTGEIWPLCSLRRNS